MRLTVVGCSGSFPGPDSPASCYLVEQDGFRLLLDLGSGALGALQRHTRIADVGAVMLSHLHADHCLDLCGMYVARRYNPGGPLPRIPVWGPSGVADRLARAYDMATEPGMTAEFDFHEYDPATAEQTLQVGPFQVVAVRVVHPVTCYALRLTAGGKVLTYSGDTGPSQALVTAARDADVLLVEASFRSGERNPPDLHLTGREAGEHATQAGARRVIGTHVPPWYTQEHALVEIRQTFDGPAEMARPDATYEI